MTAIYLFIRDQQAGPYSFEQVGMLLGSGQITNETPAWYEGLSEWVVVGSLNGPPPFVQPFCSPIPVNAQLPSRKSPQPIQNPALVAGIGLIIFWCVLLPSCLFNGSDLARTTNQSQGTGHTIPPPLSQIPDLAPPSVSNTSKYPALDEKNGFRDYILGRSFSKFNPADLGSPFNAGDEHRYMLERFDKSFGNFEITSIRLDFEEGYLTRIIICVDGDQNTQALKEAFITAYGQPEKGLTVYPSFVWAGDNVSINLQTDRDIVTGAISAKAFFQSRSVTTKIQEITTQKAKQGAADAAKSL